MTISPKELARALSVAEYWTVHDPDPQTKNETISLINLITLGETSAEPAVVDQFGERLTFGTAGLRAEIGAGPSRMNKMVVMQTSAGLAKWLSANRSNANKDEQLSVVVGFDARTKSDVFARATAEVFAGAGFKTILLPGPLPTPLTAFAVRYFNATAGVMITASHNPPKDNGYKVFLGGDDAGSQIASPVDSEISAAIDEVAKIALAEIPTQNNFEFAGDEIFEAYIENYLADWQAPETESKLKIVYTAMHGVGAFATEKLFAKLNFPKLIPVDAQNTPDPAFPTVDFPNPEEPGALDLAYSKAREVDADLIIAHDPDADRLAIAIPAPETDEGYVPLTGNELGLLLGWAVAERHASNGGKANGGKANGGSTNVSDAEESGVPGNDATGHEAALACTIVSSPALKKVAAKYNLKYAETLSGFKWVSRVPNLIFGFEEALGYLTRPDLVRDKDGISAAADLITLALELEAAGKTIADRLEEAADTFGAFASSQITQRLGNSAEVTDFAEKVRENPPTSFGEVRVANFVDLQSTDSEHPPANVLKFELADGSRVMVRPSGTEPKLKIYLDTFADSGSAKERITAAKIALAELEQSVKETLGL